MHKHECTLAPAWLDSEPHPGRPCKCQCGAEFSADFNTWGTVTRTPTNVRQERYTRAIRAVEAAIKERDIALYELHQYGDEIPTIRG